MTRVTWLTDIHLNFLDPQGIETFLSELCDAQPDVVLLGGDIGESQNVRGYLQRLGDALQAPIYFVLGNHDYYHGSIVGVRDEIRTLGKVHPWLHYLTYEQVSELAPQIALIGHDGWGDARAGDYRTSKVQLNDYQLIDELIPGGRKGRRPVLQALGDQAADHVRKVLPEALERYQQVVLLTHVPPLREACWHEGRLSDDQWSPHFVCQAMGEALLQIMSDWPEHRLTVLCGHTHSRGECRPLPNVEILTGGAEYGYPSIQRVFEL
jgi:predicted phosphohydrolase